MSDKANAAQTSNAVFDDFGSGSAADDFDGMDFVDESEVDTGSYDQSNGETEEDNPGASQQQEDNSNKSDVDGADELELDEGGSDKPAFDKKKSDEKSKKGLDDRFSELTSQRDEAEGRADQLELENARLRKQLEGGGSEQKPAKKGKAEEPKEEDYDNYDDFLDALEEFNAQGDDQGEQEEKPANNQPAGVTEEFELAKRSVDRKIQRWEDKPEDFDSLIYAEDSTVQITQSMVIAANEMDNPGEMLYALAKNPAKAAQIAASAPGAPDFEGLSASQITQAIRALTKQASAMEALLEDFRGDGGGNDKKSKQPGKQTKNRKLKTDAPDPITETRGDASSGSQKDINDMSYEELDAHMSANGDDPWW